VITLLDANILVHAANGASPVHQAAKRLRDQAVAGDVQACLTPQVLWEFYAVITNPRRVDRPLSPPVARQEVQAYMQAERIPLLVPTRSTMTRVLGLLARYPVTGLRIFDLFLVATMLDHGVRQVYTENVDDFRPFEGIATINPLASVSLSP
jgi:toxin-antitoxin system PIN domain toxin